MGWKDNLPRDGRYYETENGVLFCGDCVEIMGQIPDHSVDLVLTDPPYGLGLGYDSFDDTQDNVKELVSAFMPLALRVGCRVVLTCGQTNMWHYPQPDWVMAWTFAGVGLRNSWGFTTWQPILCYGKDPFLASRKGARSDTIYDNVPAKGDGSHPCPKPISFWMKLLQRCSVDEKDIILDPFLGSGTTAVACERLGRRWIGIEISEKYCEIAKQRIRTLERTPTLNIWRSRNKPRKLEERCSG